MLTEYLAGRDVACPGCGYNLRGLQGAQCPECHEVVVLSVQLVEPKLYAYLASVIGLAVGAGFCGLLLLLFCYFNRFSLSREPQNRVLLVGLVVETSLMIALLRGRPSFRRMSMSQRVCSAVGCWALTAVVAVWLAMVVK